MENIFCETIFIPILIIILLFDGLFKAIALWKSARNNHLAWFVCIVIFNTAGILPIVYLLIQRSNAKKMLER